MNWEGICFFVFVLVFGIGAIIWLGDKEESDTNDVQPFEGTAVVFKIVPEPYDWEKQGF